MLSMDPAMLGRLNTKSLQEKMEEKAKLLVSVVVRRLLVVTCCVLLMMMNSTCPLCGRDVVHCVLEMLSTLW